jgi:hypothetical protein
MVSRRTFTREVKLNLCRDLDIGSLRKGEACRKLFVVSSTRWTSSRVTGVALANSKSKLRFSMYSMIFYLYGNLNINL